MTTTLPTPQKLTKCRLHMSICLVNYALEHQSQHWLQPQPGEYSIFNLEPLSIPLQDIFTK